MQVPKLRLQVVVLLVWATLTNTGLVLAAQRVRVIIGVRMACTHTYARACTCARTHRPAHMPYLQIHTWHLNHVYICMHCFYCTAGLCVAVQDGTRALCIHDLCVLACPL